MHANTSHPALQELGIFLLAVIIGSVSGVAATLLLARWLSAASTGTAAIAVATACTGAAHSHFVHKQPWGRLVPKVGVGAPLAYGVMRLVHVLLGS